jgi:hypothetical protein
MYDQIGSAHMTQGMSTTFTLDRFGNVNSALALNGGWTQVPPGIYFDTPEFTISAWIMPQQVGYWARLVDFAWGSNQDSIVLTLDSSSKPCPFGFIESFALSIEGFSFCLTLNQWQLLTATFDGNIFSIYINGTLSVSGAKYSGYSQLPTINRNQNYIGKSNAGPSDGYSHSFIDDLRFYNKSLTQQEIVDLIMMNDVNNAKCLMTSSTASTMGNENLKDG